MKIKYILNITLLVLFLVNPLTAHANTYFTEEFDNGFSNRDNWTIENPTNSGVISFENYPGSISLSSTQRKFPFLYVNRNLVPDGNFEIELSFQYLYSNTYYYGTGIVVTETFPSSQDKIIDSNNLFVIWQDNVNKLVLDSFICQENTPNCSSKTHIYQSSSQDTNVHTVRIKYFNQKYEVTFDNKYKYITVSTSRRPESIWIGNSYDLGFNSSNWAPLNIDYIRVKRLPDHMLEVPHYEQDDDVWENDQLGNSNYTIGGSGCAMTSAAMLLNYYGYTISPSGLASNPQNLNEWLKNNHGYGSNGNLMWPAVARFAKEAKNLGWVAQNLPDLEFTYPVFTFDAIQADLLNKIPSAVQIVQNTHNTTTYEDDDLHFVAARGFDDNSETIYINDPLDSTPGAQLSDNYSGKIFRKFARYAPSIDNNLSYIWLKLYSLDKDIVVEKDGKKTGVDSNGTAYAEISGAEYFSEGVIAGEELTNTSGQGSKNFIIPKPSDGIYNITVFGDPGSDLDMELFTYDKEANAKVFQEKRTIDDSGILTYTLTYTSEPGNQETNLNLVPPAVPVTFSSVRQYIKEQYELRNIKNFGIRTMLITKLTISERLYQNNHKKLAIMMINNEIKNIKHLSPKIIKPDTAKELTIMLEELKNGL